MPSASDLTNKVFGDLTALYPEGKPVVWVCMCSCGNTTKAPAQRLNSGNTKSCGCRRVRVSEKLRLSHGLSKSRTYMIWQAMKDRCSNSNRMDYYRYGGRGITVCDRWLTFQNFIADMGDVPKGLTLDRIDNDKGYSPDNCRWATRKEQVHNSTKVKLITLDGVTKPLVEWLEFYAISRSTYYSRIRSGISPEDALSEHLL